MTPEAQRIAIAALDGWVGCSDSACPYRKAQHLHKGIVVGFPEPYSVPRYPDYLRSLDAMHEVETTLDERQQDVFARHLGAMIGGQRTDYGATTIFTTTKVLFATAAQRAEALLRTLNKWDDTK